MQHACTHTRTHTHTHTHTILANPPVFPGKIPENQHSSRGPGDFKRTPGKTTVFLIQDFPENSMVSPRMSRFFELFSNVCTVLTRTSNCAQHFQDLAITCLACKTCTDKVTDRRRLIKLHYRVELCCTQICRSAESNVFWARKAVFHLFSCHPGILREIQGFCMSCQGIEIVVVGQYDTHRVTSQYCAQAQIPIHVQSVVSEG